MTVVITGASSGIGLAIAEAFARQGANIVLTAYGIDSTEIDDCSTRSLIDILWIPRGSRSRAFRTEHHTPSP
jgi:NAD(P)-dependent dehydrogenase (short-subunit alcohol dehydrogenase family)